MNATRVILRFSKRKKCMEATLEEKPISKEDVESAPATKRKFVTNFQRTTFL